MNQLNGFDPILFLDLKNIKLSEKQQLSDELMIQISDYLAVRFIELLPNDKLEEINSQSDLFNLTKEGLSDFDDKVKQFLDDFKIEFLQNLKK